MILHYTNRTEYIVTLPLEIYFELHAKIHSKTLQNGTAKLLRVATLRITL